MIRELKQCEQDEGIHLAWTVFEKFEAPEYSKEGIDTFYQCLHDQEFVEKLRFYGAFEDGNMVGVLATRSKGNHIALFFVDEKYQKKGIGKKLFEKACKENKTGKMTVNSSPYAVEVYHHLGFVDTDVEQTDDGIRYTPMVCEIKR